MAFILPFVAAAVGALAASAGAGLVLTAVLQIGGALVLSALGSALAPKPKRPSFDTQSIVSGRTEMVRQPVTARRTIYGFAMVSGPLVYIQTYGKAEGIPNAFISMIIPLAAHECGEIIEVWFGDQECKFRLDSSSDIDVAATVTDPFSTKYRQDPAGGADIVLNANGVNFAFVYKHLGTSSQVADERLVADSGGKWTSSHRLRGICYVHVKLRYDSAGTLFSDGVPKVRCLVRGKLITDTRTGTTASVAARSNPALCIYDYLTSELGIATSAIDTASVDEAASVCDEPVPIRGGSQTRYTLNGTVDSDERPVDVLKNMLSAMAGTLIYSGGKFYLYAGSETAATITLDEDDLAGPISVTPRMPRRDLMNGVKAIYVDQSTDYQPRETPVVSSTTYVEQDNDEEIIRSVDLPFTVNGKMAQRIAKIELERARQQIVVEMTVKLVGLQLQAWDTVLVDNDLYGWSAKKFRVVNWQLNEDATVSLTLREEADEMWEWDFNNDEQDEDPAQDTELADPRDVPAPGAFSFTEELRATAGNVVTIVTASFGAVSDGLFDRYEVQFKKTADTLWKFLGSGEGTEYETPPLEDNVSYDFRARAINAIGAKSTWTTGVYITVGQSGPPSDIEDFSANIVAGEIHLSWDAVTDADLSHYRIRYSSATAGVTWTAAVDLLPRVSKHATGIAVPARVGTYLIKAVDVKGNESENEVSIVTTVPAITGLNVVSTIVESTLFAGTHDGTALVDGRIVLDTEDSLLFDSVAGNFDDRTGLFDAGGGVGFVNATGTYNFALTSGAVLDLGSVYYPNRLTAEIEVVTLDYANQFDDAAGNFDDRAGNFDGSIVADTNVHLEVRTTDDDPSGAPTWSAWRNFVVGDYKARAFDFRAILTSTNTAASPGITSLTVTVDMPDRIVEEHDVASGAGSYAVTFPGGAFRAVPAVGIAAQGLATGDFYELTLKTATGFTIHFKNSGGASVSRTFDYIARGFGISA